MRNICGRLNNVEKKLNLDKKRVVVTINNTWGNESKEFDWSYPSEQWLTYPEAVENAHSQGGLIVLDTTKEIAARKEQVNASKRQSNEQYEKTDLEAGKPGANNEERS
ncbi:MAG: hypothetical protein ACYSTF_09020 [Planctomycetota bacterium]|jgi:hypothetical protein